VKMTIAERAAEIVILREFQRPKDLAACGFAPWFAAPVRSFAALRMTFRRVHMGSAHA